jgi:hypothetical protein
MADVGDARIGGESHNDPGSHEQEPPKAKWPSACRLPKRTSRPISRRG